MTQKGGIGSLIYFRCSLEFIMNRWRNFHADYVIKARLHSKLHLIVDIKHLCINSSFTWQTDIWKLGQKHRNSHEIFLFHQNKLPDIMIFSDIMSLMTKLLKNMFVSIKSSEIKNFIKMFENFAKSNDLLHAKFYEIFLLASTCIFVNLYVANS